MPDSKAELDKLYNQRFPEAALAQKHAIWKVLCSDFFGRYVKPTDTVVDIGIGVPVVTSYLGHEHITFRATR